MPTLTKKKSPPDDRLKVDRELRKLGFGGLDDPNLIVSIAFCIRDHAQFRSQLFSVEPLQRRAAYESLRPHLRFAAKPLDVYEQEIRLMAEQQQWPTYDKATHQMIPFNAEANLSQLATDALKQNAHEKHGGLEMVCNRCTVAEVFRAPVRKDAEKLAHAAGWRSDGVKCYCPKHVPGRCTMTIACEECEKEEKIRCWEPQDGYAKARMMGWVIHDAARCPGCAQKRLVTQ